MLKKIALGILLLIVAASIYIVSEAFPILTSYGAKNLCSCVFISEREPPSVITQELSGDLINLGNYTIDYDKKSATGTIFGLAKRTAIFRDNLGCTLLPLNDNKEITTLDLELTRKPENPDTIPWPYGDRIALDDDLGPVAEKVQKIVRSSFTDAKYINPKGTRGVVVIKDSMLIAEHYADEFDKNTPQLGWSMTKSVINALIGILIEQGKIASTSQNQLLETWEDERKEITLDHLLRMSSGLKWSEVYAGPSDATHMLFLSYSAGEFAAEKPLEYDPGSFWYYSSGTTNILSTIIRNEADKMYPEFAFKYLFNAIGMRSAIIEPDPSGTYVGSSFMWATPRDWARFGLLYLYNGYFNGQKILPDGWVTYSSKVTSNSKGRYGAHFWTNQPDPETGIKNYPDAPEDLFSANGFQGQRVFIIPSKNMVIVRLGYDEKENFNFNDFLIDIIEATE